MTTFDDPPIKPSATRQGAMYRARRSHRANGVVGTLTAWSHGLVVTEGQYVQNDGNAYVALSSGTTGATAPVGVTTAVLNDGGVTWQFVNNRIFLTNQTPSTPGASIAATATFTATGNPAADTALGQIIGLGEYPEFIGSSYRVSLVLALSDDVSPNEALIGDNLAATLANLTNLINGGPGSNTTYKGSANTQVSATTNGTAVVLTALTPGAAGNTIEVGSVSGTLSFLFLTPTLTGGYETTAATAIAYPAGATTWGVGSNNAANGDTVTIGGVTYTFQTTLTAGSAGQVHVHISASASGSATNLEHAINNSGGTPGTDYSTSGTGANPDVTAGAAPDDSLAAGLQLTAITAGASGNSISVASSTAMTAGWTATFLNGGE